MNDFQTTSGLSEVEDGSTGSFTISNNDYLDINIATAVGNKTYYAYNTTNLNKSRLVYPKIKVRYKCGNGTIKVKIVIVYNDASIYTLLDETNNESWTLVEANIPQGSGGGNTVEYVRLYANQSTGHVYYDFVLICNEFTFPSATRIIPFLPQPRMPLIEPPTRDGIIPQNLGSNPATVTILGDMDLGDWDLSTDDTIGAVFYSIWHNASSELWQWFSSPEHGIAFKVCPNPNARSSLPLENGKLSCHIELMEYRLGNLNQETYIERFGIT